MGSFYQYFLTEEFRVNILWILIFSTIVTISVCLIRGFFKGNRGEGLFPYLVFFFVVAVPAYAGLNLLYNFATKKSLGDMAFVCRSVNDRLYGPVAVIRDDKVRLFEHYRNLLQRKKSCDNYLEKLKKEKSAMSDAGARRVLDREIAATDSELKTLDMTLQSIDDLATKVYFSRFMSNLGANISSSELNGEMDRLIIRASVITKELDRSERDKSR